MKQMIEAEFKVVQERTLEVIATEIRTIDNHVCQVALQGAIEIGDRLKEAKEKIGHGKWESWCKENLDYSKSQAERFMKISTEYGAENSPYLSALSKTYTCTDLSISKAFRLLQVPEDEVEAFVENNNPEDLTVKELEEKIKALQEEKEDVGDELVAVQEDYDRTKKEKEVLEKQIRELEEKMMETDWNKEGDAEEVKAAHEALEKAQKEKEAAEQKAAKLKEKLDKEKANAAGAAEKAKEEAKVEAAEAARRELQKEIDKAEAAKAEAEKAAQEAAEREAAAMAKLDKAANPDLAVFGVKRQILMETFEDMLAIIDRADDSERREKLKAAAGAALEQLEEELKAETLK